MRILRPSWIKLVGISRLWVDQAGENTRIMLVGNDSPLPYLTDVLRKLADDWPTSRLEELLPDCWQRLHRDASDANGSRHTTDLSSTVTVMA